VSILLTGGAGYIGSHINQLLSLNGIKTIVLDDESTGSKEKIKDMSIFIRGDIRDTELVRKTLIEHKITGVIHLAAKKSVSESIKYPDEYMSVNVDGTSSVINACLGSEVSQFIFSSSAAIYGNSEFAKVSEDVIPHPLSVYGDSKLQGERLVSERLIHTPIKFTNLRYFNVVGSANRTLQDNSKENLFPIIREALASGRQPVIFGSNHPTPDGTCIRDYIHVQDLAEIHLLTLKKLNSHQFPKELNVGSGLGFSVLEVITEFVKQTKSNLVSTVSEPRIGDPAKLIANIDRLKKALDFTPGITLSEMVASTL